jgi:hypothetical protein
MTIQVNLIYSKLVFFKKNTKTKHTEKNHSNSASELHCAHKHIILKNSYELLCKIHVKNIKLHEIH